MQPTNIPSRIANPPGSRTRTPVVFVVALLAVLLLAGPALAQVPTATLTGRVSNDAVDLPGVTVAAKSPSLQGTRTTVTGASGDYALGNLPPGEYTITFALQGFKTLTQTKTLGASRQERMDANLSITAQATTTVTAQSDAISQTASQATTYTTEMLSKLPTGRTVTAAVILSPGLNQNGPNGVSIAGAQSTENLYTVNGVVITDNVRSSATNLFIEDAIQETTTTTSTVSAEYGRFTGGVINTITKSGGNTFSGSLRSTLTNDSWASTSAYRDPVTGANPQEGIFIDKTIPTWEATLGGPIVRDVAWFFGAGRYYDTSEAVAGVTRYTNVPYVAGTKELRFEGKLTLTPFQNHTLTGSYIKTNTEQHNYYFTSIPVADLDSIYDRQQPTDLLAINYNGVLTNSFLLEAQYSNKKFTFQNSGGRYTDVVKGTVLYDLARGTTYNAPIFCAVCGPPETRDNNNYVIKGTYFLSSPSLGSHNIVAGYDDFGGQRMSNNYQSASNYIVYTQTASIVQGSNIYPVINSSTEIDWWPVLKLSEGSDVRTRSFYLNDTWRFSNRLSFNLGVRYDKNDATNQAGQVTSDDSAFSPRLAATYDVKGDGKFRVSASYAKYVAALQETQAGSAASLAGTPADFWWYYDGPGINTDPTKPLLNSQQALTQLFAWFQARGCQPDPLAASCTVPLDGANIGGVNQQIRESLVSPNTNEYVLGIAGSIGSRGTFRADLVRREYADYYDTRLDMTTGQVTNPISGAKLDLSLVVNSNDYRREYTGLHTQFSYRIGDRLNLGGNWTWSHLIGDLVGETSGSGPTRGGLHAYPEYFDRAWNAPVGSLSSDTRHRVRLYGTYGLPVPPKFGDLSVSFVQSWDTGTPYGAVGSVATRTYVTNPGYVSPPASVTYYFTARDAFRTDDIFRTDLSLYYSYRIANSVDVFITPQVFNVFNSQHVVSVNTAVETRVTNSASYAAFNPFTTAPTQGARGTGANWNYGPNFGKPTASTSFQTPRYFLVSMGVRF